MNVTFSALDLALVVAVDNLNPTLLNLDFLRASGIVPQEWELSRPAVFAQQVSQLLFANGISIVAQPDRIVFLAPLAAGEELAAQAASIAQKYVQALPQAQYQAVGINLRGCLQSGESGLMDDFFTTKLLQSGPWLEEGTQPVNPSLTLNYSLSTGPLTLTITPAQIQFSDQAAQQSILFAGNYSNTLEGSSSERFIFLQRQLFDWQQRLGHFYGLINEKFMGKSDSLLSTNLPTNLAVAAVA